MVGNFEWLEILNGWKFQVVGNFNWLESSLSLEEQTILVKNQSIVFLHRPMPKCNLENAVT